MSDKPDELPLSQARNELPAKTSATPPQVPPWAEGFAGSPSLVRMESTTFAGPLPPPDILQQYDQIHTGLAHRIVTMAEKEQAHRHDSEIQALRGSIGAEKRGQWFAFVLCGLAITGSIYLIAHGHPFAGTLIGGGTLAGLAYVFIAGRPKQTPDQPDDDSSGSDQPS